MSRAMALAATALSGALAVTTAAPANSFSFATIAVLGADVTLAVGINNVGQIVGTFADAGLDIHGFVATR